MYEITRALRRADMDYPSWARGASMVEEVVALALSGTVLVLAAFTISHMHGISDPGGLHTFGTYFLHAQARTGVITSVPFVLIFVSTFVTCVFSDQRLLTAPLVGYPSLSRAPPLSDRGRASAEFWSPDARI